MGLKQGLILLDLHCHLKQDLVPGWCQSVERNCLHQSCFYQSWPGRLTFSGESKKPRVSSQSEVWALAHQPDWSSVLKSVLLFVVVH